MQITTKTRYHYIAMSMDQKNNYTTPTDREDLEPLELSYNAEKNVKWYNQPGRQLDNFLTKLNIHLPCDLVILFLCIDHTELKYMSVRRLVYELTEILLTTRN